MKKLLLIIALTLLIFQMVVLAIAIDIGSPAIDRSSAVSYGTTNVTKCNPANESGIITSIEIYAVSGYSMVNCEIATFFVVSGNYLSTRDTEYIGDVPAGKQTFEVNLTVEAGDYIGLYWTFGRVERGGGFGDPYWYENGDQIPCTNHLFNYVSNLYTYSIYGTGTTEEEEANAIFFGTNF